MRLAFAELMRVAATSTTIPVTNAVVEEYANTSFENSRYTPTCAGSFESTSAPWRKHEILRMAALNARKQRA
jgi:hypothetical protein